MLFRNARYRAKKKGIPFNIDISDIVVPTHCPITGEPLVPNYNGKHENNPNSPTLDRIDPSKGYVKGNVWVISHRANTIKNNATPEELMLVATKVYEHLYCAQQCDIQTNERSVTKDV